MKTKRLLLLVMAICLTSGMKAQFYDGPDDIYYYVEYKYEYEETYGPGPRFGQKTGKMITKTPSGDDAKVYVFNFDGKKAAILASSSVSGVKNSLKNNPNCYEDAVETTDYNLKHESGSVYKRYDDGIYFSTSSTFNFSYNRGELILTTQSNSKQYAGIGSQTWTYYKRVEKSYFKVGRSRTPSSTLHE